MAGVAVVGGGMGACVGVLGYGKVLDTMTVRETIWLLNEIPPDAQGRQLEDVLSPPMVDYLRDVVMRATRRIMGERHAVQAVPPMADCPSVQGWHSWNLKSGVVGWTCRHCKEVRP